MTLVWLSLAWGAGIALASWTRLATPLWALAGLAGLAAALVWRAQPRRRLAGWLVVAAALGAARWGLAQPQPHPGELASFNGQSSVTLRGYISDEPSARATYTQLQFTASAIQRDGAWQPVRGKAVLNVPHYPTYAYGDRLEVSGRLETPPVLDDFDYKDYLAA
ncbi:MAG: ComEC/Rec2 family competence protein, partial [Chloroflexota bacterium]